MPPSGRHDADDHVAEEFVCDECGVIEEDDSYEPLCLECGGEAEEEERIVQAERG